MSEPEAYDPRKEAAWLIEPGIDGGEEIAYGVRRKWNPHLGIWFYQLHHSADPQKRSKEWRARTFEGNPGSNTRQEYDLEFGAPMGRPVWTGIFSARMHIQEPVWDPFLPLIMGIDFGLTPAAILGQVKSDGHIDVLAEVVAEEVCPLREFLEDLFLPYVATNFPSRTRPILPCCDPAGSQRSQTNGESPIDVMREFKLPPIPGQKEWSARYDLMTRLFRQSRGESALLRIHRRCHWIIRGCQGGYRFPMPKPGQDINTTKPVKDAYSHPQDALQYFCFRAQMMLGQVDAPAKQETQRRQDFRPHLLPTRGEVGRSGFRPNVMGRRGAGRR